MAGKLASTLTRPHRVRLVLLGVGVAVFGAAAPAMAATRYAEPAGNGPEPCAVGDPCAIQDAVMGTAPGDVTDGDEVVVLPGTYNVSGTEIDVLDAIDVHGAAGQPHPVVLSTAGTGFYVGNPGATLRNLTIDASDANQALYLANGTVDGVIARRAGSGYGHGCLTQSGLLRNSVCFNSGTGGPGAGSSFGGAPTHLVLLRNVTAVSTAPTSYGLDFETDSSGSTTVDAKSVIASGITGDVLSSAEAGSTTTVTLDHSNYGDVTEVDAGTATPAGSPTNQTAAPIFFDAANGDFHQALGSPTIDAGETDGNSGSEDFDGEARLLGAAPDIGADEWLDSDGDGVADAVDGCPTVAASTSDGCPAAAGDTNPPQTKITKHPKKKAKKAKAKFAFKSDEPGSTFECKLDKKPYRDCDSPFKKKVKADKKHRFAVRATDAAGNVDPTPAKYAWKTL